MTAIAGIVGDDGTVWIGGDSAGVAGFSVTARADEKVFANGPYLFGFTSSFRMGQLLRYAFTPPVPDKCDDTYGFLVTTFVDAVRKCLKDGGYAETSNGRESGGTFLLGFLGSLYRVCGDFQVGRSRHGFDAVGCGDDLVLGALYASRTSDATPKDRIRTALSAAATFSGGVCAPFVVKSGGAK